MIYQPISRDLSADISNIGRFLLQTIWQTISPYCIGSRQKKRYRLISRPIFKTGVSIVLILSPYWTTCRTDFKTIWVCRSKRYSDVVTISACPKSNMIRPIQIDIGCFFKPWYVDLFYTGTTKRVDITNWMCVRQVSNYEAQTLKCHVCVEHVPDTDTCPTCIAHSIVVSYVKKHKIACLHPNWL